MRHLIWQMTSGFLAVTGNLTRRYVQCDNHCLRCGEDDETVNHAIFECPPALQTWSLASTSSCPNIFPISSVYIHLDYIFWRNGVIEDPELDRDPYPWIVWYLWKARNDKLFRGIKPIELLRHVQRECDAWFQANSIPTNDMIPPNQKQGTQALCLQSICLVDGSWTSDSHCSGYGWVWLDETGKEQILGLRNNERRLSPLHSKLEALIWAMDKMVQHKSC